MLDTPIIQTLRPLICKAQATKERQPFYVVVGDVNRIGYKTVKKYYVIPHSLVDGKCITNIFHDHPPGSYINEWDTVAYNLPTFVDYWDAYTYAKCGKTLKEISDEPASNPNNKLPVAESQGDR